MWERFSFYGMQGILTIYLSYSAAQGGLGLPKATATSVVGAYGGLVYLSTVIGAWLADRVIGSERVLFGSAVVIMFGHISLAVIPRFLGVGIGLAVGSLYRPDDERRREAPYFAVVGGAAVLFGILLALASPAIRKLMSGVH